MKFESFADFQLAIDNGELDQDDFEIWVDNDDVYIGFCDDEERYIEINGVTGYNPSNALVSILQNMGFKSLRP